MNIRILALPLVCAASLAAFSAQAADLAEVYARALQNDPLIREAEANRLAALESKPQALSSLLPQLSAGADYTNRDSSGESPFWVPGTKFPLKRNSPLFSVSFDT